MQIDEATQKELETLKKEFEEKFSVLKKEQDAIIADFIDSVRTKRVDEIKASI